MAWVYDAGSRRATNTETGQVIGQTEYYAIRSVEQLNAAIAASQGPQQGSAVLPTTPTWGRTGVPPPPAGAIEGATGVPGAPSVVGLTPADQELAYQREFGTRESVGAAVAVIDTQARRDALLQKFHELASGRTKSDAELEFEKQYQAAAQASYGSATNVKGVNSVDAANFRSSQQAEMQSNQMATQKALHESIAKAARQQEAALAADIAKGAMSKEALDNWYAQGLAGIDAAAGRSAFNTSFQGAAGEYGRTSRQGRNALADWYAQDSSARGAAQAGAGALGAGLSMYSTFKGK